MKPNDFKCQTFPFELTMSKGLGERSCAYEIIEALVR